MTLQNLLLIGTRQLNVRISTSTKDPEINIHFSVIQAAAQSVLLMCPCPPRSRISTTLTISSITNEVDIAIESKLYIFKAV